MKVQFNNIPEGIRGKPLYCLAKLEQKPGKNKPDKIPYQITGARASPSVINKLVRGPNQLILCKITFIFKFFQFSIERLTKLELQVRKLSDMTLVIESTKTSAGTRKIPVTEDVAKCFQAIIEDREKPKVEKVVDGYTGFLFLDDKGLPLVAMHWEHRFNHMVKRYNDIYRVQMPNITPHVCRHTYCSNMAKSGMNPKTL